jgi:tetratricopeptide (TPR) repeat protein
MTDRAAAIPKDIQPEDLPVPRYEDEDAESLGEKLAELYARRDNNPRARIDDVIESTRRELRRGPRLRAGEFLNDGRYRLIERIGDSAGDATWRAWDRARSRLVIIREMVGPWVAKRMRVGAFLEAARTLQNLDHSGLAPVHEAKQSRDGFVYLAIDELTGGRFDAFEGDQVDLLQAVIEVGSALQAAHDAGLVHARVRPEAIFFDEHGGARLTDFDLAGEHVHGDSGSVYVAPELVERGMEATPAADVYALAMCTLYGLNGNRLPYTVVRGPERFIDGLDVAESVKVVLKKAVDWDLETRFATMTDMVAGLLADDHVLASLAQRAWEKRRYVIASEHYTALWALRPEESVQIKHILGQIYLKMETWEEAYACLSSALEETTDPDPLYEHLREYAVGTDDWKRVADLLWNQARNRPPVARASMRAELARITEQHLADPRGASEVWTLVVQDHRTPARAEEALSALRRLAEEREDWGSFVEHSQELLPYLDGEARPDVQYAIGRAMIQQLDDEDTGLVWIDRAEAAGVKPLDMAAELQEIRARRGQWRRLIGLMRLEADHEKKVHQASRILLRAATIARAVHLEAEAEAIYENMLERAPQHYPALRELARMRHRSGRSDAAMQSYEALTAHYEGRSEEPEASERAADHTAYATLLLEQERVDAAVTNLEAALRLQPDNIEALTLSGPLYLDLGRLEDGALSLEKLYALFKAVKTDGARLDAALQRADAAWFRGRLAVAMRWYNSVLATVPDHERAWWGLAKVAMAARGGHPGTDRAPWLSATPERFTAHEALARLLMGLFTQETMTGWLSRHPLGRGIVKAGDTPARSACAVVDLLDRYGLIGPLTFDRLSEAYPDWQSRIDAVQRLFDGGDDIRIERTYRWARAALELDFDLELDRAVLPAELHVQGRLPGDLHDDDAWRLLLGGEQPAEPAPEPPRVAPSDADSETLSAVELVVDGTIEFTLRAWQSGARIGADPTSDWSWPDLEAHHAVLRRIGPAIYLERVGDAPVTVDGEEVPGWRLLGGEKLALGPATFDVRCREDDQEPPTLEEDADSVNLDDEDDAEVTQVNLPHLTVEQLEALSEAEEAEDEAEADEPDEAAADEPDEPDEAAADEPDEPEADDAEASASEVASEESDEAAADEQPPALPDDSVTMSPDGATTYAFDEGATDAESEAFDELEAMAIQRDPPRFLEADEDSIPEPVALDVDGIPALADAPEVDLGEQVDDDPDFVDAGTVEMSLASAGSGFPGVGFDEEEATVAIRDGDVEKAAADPFDVGDIVERQSPPSDDAPPPQPMEVMEVEPVDEDDAGVLDSLGPAGDAPTPQWLTAAEAEEPDLVATHVARPTLVAPQPDDLPEQKPSAGGQLEVMSGPARGTVVPVDGVLALGRDPSCEVHLPADPMLSDIHCRFVASDAGFLIMDNGSDRGTMVDGSRVSEATLRGGETIMVGSTVLRFVLRG